jgi:hypothetical protein
MIEDQIKEKQAAFEKARFEYCVKIYERKETLEKKSQFLLSIIVLFLGAIFLKSDFFKALQELIAQKSIRITIIWAMYVSMAVLAASLMFSLVAVLQSIRLQRFKNEYPENLISSLFAPDSKYFTSKVEDDFFSETAMSYAIAIEFNSKNNERKAGWVKAAWFSMLIAAISLSIFLSLFAYISIL